MHQFFTPARRAFQGNLDRLDPRTDLALYDFYAGMVALVSGLETEIPQLHARLDQLQSQVDDILRRVSPR